MAELIAVVVAEPPNVPLAVAPDAVNVTVTPETGLFPTSFTMAISGFAYAAPMVANCPPPLYALTLAAGPDVLVSEKLAEVVAPVALAVIVKAPAMRFAAKDGELAWPLDPVTAVTVVEPLKVALAPGAGAVKVTVAPETALPPMSFTTTPSVLENVVLIGALSGVNPTAVTVDAAPALFVSEKVAALPTGETVAFTL